MDTLLTVTLKGSILQSSKGKYGHVAYIETINEDGSMQVSEMNYTQPYEITKRTIHTYDIKIIIIFIRKR